MQNKQLKLTSMFELRTGFEPAAKSHDKNESQNQESQNQAGAEASTSSAGSCSPLLEPPAAKRFKVKKDFEEDFEEEKKSPEIWCIDVNRPYELNLEVVYEVVAQTEKAGLERQTFKLVHWLKHLNSASKFGPASKKLIDIVGSKLKGIASLVSCKMLFYGGSGFVEWHDDVVKHGPEGWSWDIAFHHHLLLGPDGSIFDTLRATFVLLYYSSAVP